MLRLLNGRQQASMVTTAEEDGSWLWQSLPAYHVSVYLPTPTSN